MSDLPLEQPTPLDLELHGSAGRFRVGAGESRSLLVSYFLTNVGLALESGTNSKLLDHLAPVREIFRVDELDFNELMQRDIDDARVTSELIPYLLDKNNAQLVKLFPPIVVMILPVAPGSKSPQTLYPPVETFLEPVGGFDREVTRIGTAGSEILRLEQFIQAGMRNDHDRVRLRLNTHGTRLVIVDGQHRAMALLAIYRNMMDQWSDEKRAPYKDFYEEWSPALIGQFNLEDVQLPIMLCFVPELQEGTEVDFDLIRAARRVFLTLNKTARKVSDSRNRLLDDADLMAVFLRSTLARIKARQSTSGEEVMIWEVELDQATDRTRVQSQVALTGVNHIYYVIEHLMLNSNDVNGIKARSGKYGLRTSLAECLPRLNGRDLLGDDAANSIRRDSFSSSDAEILGAEFQKSYGAYVVRMFDEFGPYVVHNSSVFGIESEVRENNEKLIYSLLFGGQGAWRVFQDHIRAISRRDEEPEIKTIREKLSIVEQSTLGKIKQIIDGRTARFVSNALGEIPDSEALKREVSDLYQNYFTTVAMQAAILGTFFEAVETSRRVQGNVVDVDSEFTNYLQMINRFFLPTSKSGLEMLLKVFAGEVSPTGEDPWRIIATERTFRKVVFPGEMQPDQWPKIRYLLLELWKPKNQEMQKHISSLVVLCRKQIFIGLFERLKNQLASSLNLPVDELAEADVHQTAKEAAKSLGAVVEALAGPWGFDPGEAEEWALVPPEANVTSDSDPEEAG